MFSSSPATCAAQEVFSQFGHCWAILLSSSLLHFVFLINNFALTTWTRSQLSPKKGHLVFFGLGIMLLFRIFSWEDSLEQHSLARGTAGVTPGILTLDAPRQAVGKDRQTEILFVSSFRLLQLQPCLSCIWTIRNKGELLASTEAGFEPLPRGRSWCGSAQTVTCGLQVA